MQEELLQLKNDALSLIIETNDIETLEEIRINFLGRQGKLTVLLKKLPDIPLEHRPGIGRIANEVKQIIEETIERQKAKGKKQRAAEKTHLLDITNPGIQPPLGHTHLVTQAIEEITAVFEKIGFIRVRYPEVEWDWYAFTALNFPVNHPARDEWETFFTTENPDTQKGHIILTPHTSSGQVREMEKAVQESKKTQQPIAIRMLNIAKCYRRQSDVSHTHMFHQFEGLVVGKQIAITHLKGVLDFFVKSYFGEKRLSRIRPYHFQFTEPSFEVDVSCGVCLGKGCKLCKAGWLEMGGAGMVHPNVLKHSGIDPEAYTGFAFGWGVERVLMMKEGMKIDDLRLLYANKLAFLEQF